MPTPKRYPPDVLTGRVVIRTTPGQLSSLRAVAGELRLTVSDAMRFALDELVEDIPEIRVFRTVPCSLTR